MPLDANFDLRLIASQARRAVPFFSAHVDGSRNLVGEQNSSVHGRNQVRRHLFAHRIYCAENHSQEDRSAPAALHPCVRAGVNSDHGTNTERRECAGQQRNRAFSSSPQFGKTSPGSQCQDDASARNHHYRRQVKPEKRCRNDSPPKLACWRHADLSDRRRRWLIWVLIHCADRYRHFFFGGRN